MILEPYIATKTYFVNEQSVSFIYDTKNHIYYILKGILSELWNCITQGDSYSSLLDFAISNNIENVLNDFIGELEEKKFIKTNLNYSYKNQNYLSFSVSEKDNCYIEFMKKLLCFDVSHNIISSIYLELTYKCNLKCKHCCNPKIDDEISFENAKRLIDEAINLGVRKVILTGGESTCNKDFLKIAGYIKTKHLELAILTNAQNFYDNEKLLDDVIDINPSYIQISLYSMNPDVHDLITGIKGSQNKTISVLRKLRNKNVSTTITCFQMSYNVNSYSDVKKFADLIGSDFSSDCYFIVNPDNNNIDAKLQQDDMEKFYLKSTDWSKPRSTYSLFCSAAYDKLSINPKLEITPCVYLNYILGDFHYNSLSEIMKNTVPVFRMKNQSKNLTECFKFDYCEYCHYCPTFTSYLGDNIGKKSSICCENAKAYYNAYKKYHKIQ